MVDEREDMKTYRQQLIFSAQVAGIDPDEGLERVNALVREQQERFEQAYTTEAMQAGLPPQPQMDVSKLREGDGYQQWATFLRGAFHGWQLRESLSGNDPFMGFILEAANAAEIEAYDYGCHSCEDAVRRVLDGDSGGVCNEPWNTLRDQLLRLKADAERWRKMNRMSFKGGAFRAVVVSPAAQTQAEHDAEMDTWIDGIVE